MKTDILNIKTELGSDLASNISVKICESVAINVIVKMPLIHRLDYLFSLVSG